MKQTAMILLGAVLASSAAAEEVVMTNTWTRASGVDALASNPANWSLRHAPRSNEVVRLAQGFSRAMIWDAKASPIVAGWVQGKGYVGVVTINTTPQAGGFKTLEVLGDMQVLGGALTHPPNDDAETWWLSLRVGGNFTVGADACVSVSGKGYGTGKGPSPGVTPGSGASHGGQGAPQALSPAGRPALTYGSIVNPTTSGSGGTAREGSTSPVRGGGVVMIEVGGDLVVEGRIAADADSNDVDGANVGGAAGGSVNLRAGGSIQGAGSIAADGGRGHHDGAGGGGGGRIALVAEKSIKMNTRRISANGGCGESETPDVGNRDRHIRAAAGTIYLEETGRDSKGGGQVIVKDWHRPTRASTRIPPDLHAVPDEGRDAQLAIQENGFVTLTASTAFRELSFTSGGLDLNGGTLIVGKIVKGGGSDATFEQPGTYAVPTSHQMDSIIFSKGSIVVRTYFKPLF
ncbi:MAG: hypothetical protein ACOX9C_00735 [Kiritimatiellia bacterium]|jgi:hypothetical protein